MTGPSRSHLQQFWRTCSLDDRAWPAAAEMFERYWDLIRTHNARAGLVGNVSEADFHLKHLADSLAVLLAWPEMLAGPVRLADMGCGAGLPGVVLAIALPSLHVTAIESNQKKAEFVALAAAELGLADRVAVVARRSRELIRDDRYRGAFDVVAARAVATAEKVIRDGRRLLAPGGSIILYKTPAALAEELPLARREADKHGLTLETSAPIHLPANAGARRFLRVIRSA